MEITLSGQSDKAKSKSSANPAGPVVSRSRTTQQQHSSKQSPNYLREYVMVEPAPLGKSRVDNTKQLAQQKRRKILLISMAVLLVILIAAGVGLWWFWQSSQTEEDVSSDVPEESIVEDVYREMLPLSDERVLKAMTIVERVIYAEPFLSFYPIGELTLDDLSETQLLALTGDGELVTPNEANYMHVVYLAEIDEGYIYLYENILIAQPIACDETENLWTNETCMTYYNVSGKTVEVDQEMLSTDHEFTQRIEGVDSYKWTFAKDDAGEYQFEKVTRVE